MKAAIGEISREPVEQLAVGRWIGRPEVIVRLDDSSLEIFMPNPVHRRPREIRILRRRHPSGKRDTAIILWRNLRRFTPQEFGRDRLLRDGMLHFAFLVEVPRPAIFRRAMLHAHSREE